MKLRSWIKDFTFYQIRKEVYPPRKLTFFKPKLKCFYWLVPGWCSVQKAVNVFSEKYLKFLTINVFGTQVHSQCIWCSAQICNSFEIEIWNNKRIIICGRNKKPNISIYPWTAKPNLFSLSFPSVWNTSNGSFLSYVLLFIVFFLHIVTLSESTSMSVFHTCSFEILTPYIKDMIFVICL